MKRSNNNHLEKTASLQSCRVYSVDCSVTTTKAFFFFVCALHVFRDKSMAVYVHQLTLWINRRMELWM